MIRPSTSAGSKKLTLRPLTTAETSRLNDRENIIDRGLQSFVEVGRALMEIRDEKLYRDIDGTFDGYCKKRWGFTRQRAHQIIDSAKVVDLVSTIVDTTPANEAQARVLAELPNEKAQATVWAKAVETAPKDKDGRPRITAAYVKSVAKVVVPQSSSLAMKNEPKSEESQHEEEAGGYEPHEAIKPLTKMDGLFTKMMEHLTEAEKILGKPALAEVHTNLDATFKSLTRARSKLKAA